jgi:hypothetical protein
MYKFAYLYVKLGYILAGIVLGVSVVFCGVAIVVLELQKPRESPDRFNFELERIQVAIRSQARTIQRAFDLDPAPPALTRLQDRTWQASSVSLSAVGNLAQQRQAALQDCHELRSLILAKLEADIGLIIGKLESANTSASSNAVGAADSSNAQENPPAGDESNALFAETSEGLSERIKECETARWTVAQILGEAKNADSRSALERAQGQISRFLEILRNERSSVSSSSEAGSVTGAPPVPSLPQTSTPSRKENARLELMSVLSMVRAAVTDGWALELTIENRLQTELEKFAERAAINGEIAGVRLMTQIYVAGLFLLLLVVAFFIAVGSDLVKAILDSAVWLSHIYTNTSSGDSGDTEEDSSNQ